ncbi:hypothetical protein FOZ63_007089, partial [Perkinsus olseni]
TVFETYLRLIYGEGAVAKCGANQLDSAVAYRQATLNAARAPQFLPARRLAELEHRSPPHADFLLGEMHRLFRPKYYLSHVFLRDVFMAYKIGALSRELSEGDAVLAVVGGVHVQGIRALLSQDNPPCDIHALACCFVDAEVLRRVWMDVFEIDLSAAASRGGMFKGRLTVRIVPQADEVEQLRDELLRRIFVQKRVQQWDDAGQCWKTVEMKEAEEPAQETGGVDSAEERKAYGVLLLEGRINPYPLEIEGQSGPTDAKTVSQCASQDTPPSKRQKVSGGA